MKTSSFSIVFMLFGLFAPAPASSASLGLVITIGEFKSSTVPPLPGTQHDSKSALMIATRLGFSAENFVVLKDMDATRAKILDALQTLALKADLDNDVFVYFSGHGTRFTDPKTKTCQEAYVPYDMVDTSTTLTELDFGAYLNAIAKKARRVFFMVDTCHAAGYSQKSGTRALSSGGYLVPKFTPVDSVDPCGQTVNYDPRRGATRALGSLRTTLFEKNVIKISTSLANEVAWSSSQFGGIATRALLQCIEGDARDLDRSGSISTSELQVCAQQKMNDSNFGGRYPPGGAPSNISISSSQRIVFPGLPDGKTAEAPPIAIDNQRELIKVLQERERAEKERIAQERAERDRIEKLQQAAERDRQERERKQLAEQQERQKAEKERIAQERAERDRIEKLQQAAERDRQERERQELERLATETAERILAYQENLERIQNRLKDENRQKASEMHTYQDALATLTDIFEQRNPRYQLQVIQPKNKIAINKDSYSFSLISDIPGYLYVLHLGSDKKTFTLLFPNKHEEFNEIPAKTRFQIPGPNWTLKATGPEGKTHLLAIVSRTKLELANFGLSNAGFFVSEDARIENRGALTRQFSRNPTGNRTLSFSANFFSVEEKR